MAHLFLDVGLLQSVVFLLVERQQGKRQQDGHDAAAHEQHLHAAKRGVGFGVAQSHLAHASQRQPENECNATSHTPRDYHGYTLGENIRHAKFGTGVIIDAIDKGSSARLTINFGANGIKELDTAFAKLEKLA